MSRELDQLEGSVGKINSWNAFLFGVAVASSVAMGCKMRETKNVGLMNFVLGGTALAQGRVAFTNTCRWVYGNGSPQADLDAAAGRCTQGLFSFAYNHSGDLIACCQVPSGS
jgi:hypothetical protein